MTTNPALVTEAEKVVDVIRERFTRETFAKVQRQLTDAPTWLQHATLQAMLTGLRREDVAELKFTDVLDGHLLVAPKKNKGKVKIAIPLDLRSEIMRATLRDAIAQCRRTGVVGQYIAHQT